MKVAITEEIIARQPPEAQAIIRMLLAQFAEFMYVCGHGQSCSMDPAGRPPPPSTLVAPSARK